ncbi:hypothetical protein GQ42DRAFT_157208 [Ramicandelaber brevisporus]|nr:hypothetical protein GQ42DRAFT_157208 [Ramicandelaber brevisporus]
MNVRTLAPYVVQLKISGKDPCTADLVDKFFCVRGNDGQRLMFPQLKELTMISCCLKSENYGVKSITASRLPQLQRLYFWDDPCHMLDRGELNHDEHEIHNWQPEYSGYVHIIIPSHRWHYLTELRIGIVSSSILMDIVDLNPQLRLLIVGSEYTDVQVENDASKYNHDVFQLDTILNRLPHLPRFQ